MHSTKDPDSIKVNEFEIAINEKDMHPEKQSYLCKSQLIRAITV
jgi:hypothetical protein